MLDAASTAAGAIASAAGAVEAGISADLAAAKAAGDGQRIQVDLQALYDYYFKVKAVHKQFLDAITMLPQDPFAEYCMEVSSISGVAESVIASANGALGTGTDSMKHSMSVIASKLGTHLCRIADTYKAYVRVDDQKSAELQAAGSSGAGDIGYGGASRAATLAAEQKALAATAPFIPGWAG
jgi:hypothetical protein